MDYRGANPLPPPPPPSFLLNCVQVFFLPKVPLRDCLAVFYPSSPPFSASKAHGKLSFSLVSVAIYSRPPPLFLNSPQFIFRAFLSKFVPPCGFIPFFRVFGLISFQGLFFPFRAGLFFSPPLAPPPSTVASPLMFSCRTFSVPPPTRVVKTKSFSLIPVTRP